MVEQAVIIAAGAGQRLRGAIEDNTAPKPLTRVCGVSLLERTIRTLAQEGIRRIVVVTGYGAGAIRQAIEKMEVLGVEIIQVENEEWSRMNGLSVLAAHEAVTKGDFLLLMADHIIDRRIPRAVINAEISPGGVCLGVDWRLDKIFDMDDATKVKVESDKIIAINKELTDFNAVDTGVFKCSQALFEALAEARELGGGDCALSDGVRKLAEQGKLTAVDVKDAYWLDVDTPQALKAAEKVLLNSLRKPLDGLVSRHLNRHISLSVTRILAPTRVSPNVITAINFLIGVGAGIFAGFGTYATMLVGAILYKLNSVMDGVDGELARLKFKCSKMGEWMDTLSDDSSNVFFIVGLTIGAYTATADSLYLVIGFWGLGVSLIDTAIQYHWIHTREQSGDLLAIKWFFDEERKQKKQPGKIAVALGYLRYFIKQDFFVLLFLVLAIFGRLHWALWLFFIGTHALLIALVSHHIVDWKRRGKRPVGTDVRPSVKKPAETR